MWRCGGNEVDRFLLFLQCDGCGTRFGSPYRGDPIADRVCMKFREPCVSHPTVKQAVFMQFWLLDPA